MELSLHFALSRLSARLRENGIPIHGCSRERVDYNGATPEQRKQGDAILAEFDWDAAPVLSVTNAQARLALIQFGILPDHVDAEIAKISDPVKRATISTLWHYWETFSIDNKDLLEMAGVLGLTDYLPEILRLAATL